MVWVLYISKTNVWLNEIQIIYRYENHIYEMYENRI